MKSLFVVASLNACSIYLSYAGGITDQARQAEIAYFVDRFGFADDIDSDAVAFGKFIYAGITEQNNLEQQRITGYRYNQYFSGYGWILKDSFSCGYSGSQHATSLANTQYHVKDEVNALGNLGKTYKRTNIRDSNGNVTEYLVQKWNNGVLENNWLELKTYDLQNHMTSHIKQKWENGSWVNLEKEILLYNAQAQKISSVFYDWVIDEWLPQYLNTAIYNNNGSLLTEYSKTMFQGTWLTLGIDSFTYNANNEQIGYTKLQIYDTIIRPYSHMTSTYDGQGNNTGYTQYHSVNDTLKPYYRQSYVYNQGRKRTHVISENWDINMFDTTQFQVFHYDNNGKIVGDTMFVKSWEDEWFIWTRRMYAYNANNNITSYIKQTNNQGSWAYNSNYAYTYDANGYADSLIMYFDDNGTPEVRRFFNYDYNSNGNLSHLRETTFLNNVWTDDDENYRYYEDVNSTAIKEPQQVMVLKVFPNPGKVVLHLQYNLNTAQEVLLSIYDTNGQLHFRESRYSAADSNTNSIDINALASGVYFAQLTCNGYADRVRFVKQ